MPLTPFDLTAWAIAAMAAAVAVVMGLIVIGIALLIVRGILNYLVARRDA